MKQIQHQLRISLAQLNPVMGDIAGNTERARAARAQAALQGADIIMFSELFLCGYPPEDMVTKPAFLDACRAALEGLAYETADGGPALLVGLPWQEDEKLFNAYAALDAGRIVGVRFKVDLPNYGVFDEKRVFDTPPLPGPLFLRGMRLGLPICEDIWREEVVECLAETGAEILLVPNGSPYWQNKTHERINIGVSRVIESGLPLVYLNQVGGQDDLVFDGASFALQADGVLAAQLPAFVEEIRTLTFTRNGSDWRITPSPLALLPEGDAGDYAACVMGLRDYVEKNRFPGVVLGLSGGVDSALCAAMAVDALGASRVHAVMMPYRFTASESLEDAAACAAALCIRYDILPISAAVEGVEACLAPLFTGTERGLTEENIQSRVRGTLLMSLSNKFGAMVLTTGNKSEMSVGYATLYGDMNGGFNPLKDLYKMQVFRLCALRNLWKPEDALGPSGLVIPERIITKPPSAELRDNQKDEDSLPPYPILDDILSCLVEQDMRVSEIIARGHAREIVERVEHLLALAEYKRRQSAPGVKVTRRQFGRDRRYPITNRFRDRREGTYSPDAALTPSVTGKAGDGDKG